MRRTGVFSAAAAMNSSGLRTRVARISRKDLSERIQAGIDSRVKSIPLQRKEERKKKGQGSIVADSNGQMGDVGKGIFHR